MRLVDVRISNSDSFVRMSKITLHLKKQQKNNNNNKNKKSELLNAFLSQDFRFDFHLDL